MCGHVCARDEKGRAQTLPLISAADQHCLFFLHPNLFFLFGSSSSSPPPPGALWLALAPAAAGI